MRCFTVCTDFTVFADMDCSHKPGVEILVAFSVSRFVHAFRATDFFFARRFRSSIRHQRRCCSLYYHHKILFALTIVFYLQIVDEAILHEFKGIDHYLNVHINFFIQIKATLTWPYERNARANALIDNRKACYSCALHSNNQLLCQQRAKSPQYPRSALRII